MARSIMALQNNDLRNYIPRNLKVVNWEEVKEDEVKLSSLVHLILSTTVSYACDLQGIPFLDEEDNNMYDEEYEELYEEIVKQLEKDNE